MLELGSGSVWVSHSSLHLFLFLFVTFDLSNTASGIVPFPFSLTLWPSAAALFRCFCCDSENKRFGIFEISLKAE